MIRSPLFFALIFCLISPFALAQVKDKPGGKDHEIIGRYQGSALVNYGSHNHEQVDIPLGQVEFDGKAEKANEKKLTLEGKLSHYYYLAPEGHTSLQVYRNYEQALQSKGFRILYACDKPKECHEKRLVTYASFWTGKSDTFKGGYDSSTRMENNGNYPPRYLVAERKRPEGDEYAVLTVTDPSSTEQDKKMGGPYYLQVVEVQKMQMGAVSVLDAKAIGGQLAQEGKAVFYGIHFDTNSATIQSASQPQLTQMAEMLKSQQQIKVFIVGHTDNVGGYAHNQGLSQRRAQSVVEALAAQGINKARLQAVGVANVAPAASNATDAGKAKNRRVEMVLQ